MSQCISCLHTSTYQQPKGRGMCMLNNVLNTLLDVRECKIWKLAPMDMVRARTVRRMIFNEHNVARLV